MNTLPLDCPWCGRANDTHEGAAPGEQPTAGAVSVCWKCGNLGVFDQSPLGPLTIRRPTDDEMREMLADPNVRAALAAHRGGGTPLDVVDNYRRNL